MTLWVDAKGKVFTNVVHKDELPVLIQTVTGLVHGHVHVRPDQRLIDELNDSGRFLAVTNAQVFDAHGQAVYLAEFLTVNKEHVVWIRPDDESGPGGQE